jgi:hypothetical protein
VNIGAKDSSLLLNCCPRIPTQERLECIYDLRISEHIRNIPETKKHFFVYFNVTFICPGTGKRKKIFLSRGINGKETARTVSLAFLDISTFS